MQRIKEDQKSERWSLVRLHFLAPTNSIDCETFRCDDLFLCEGPNLFTRPRDEVLRLLACFSSSAALLWSFCESPSLVFAFGRYWSLTLGWQHRRSRQVEQQYRHWISCKNQRVNVDHRWSNGTTEDRSQCGRIDVAAQSRYWSSMRPDSWWETEEETRVLRRPDWSQPHRWSPWTWWQQAS